MSITVLEVAEDPYFTTNPPSILGLSEGDVWGYNPIGLDDTDHLGTDLFIQTPVPNLPSWMAQPIALNDGSGSWYIPDSTVPAGTGAGTIDFTLTVEDPDGNTGTQQVSGGTIVEALLNLEFLVTTRPNQPARTYTDPVTGVVTEMVSSVETLHSCHRGTYIVQGNNQFIKRAYVGNYVNPSTFHFDSYEKDAGGWPNSLTGNVENTTVPSAIAQGTTSTELKVTPDAGGNYQKYITSGDTFTALPGYSAERMKYNLITIDSATAESIVTNGTGPNPEEVTFGLIGDTYRAGGVYDTHIDKVMVQIFKNGVEVYSRATAVAEAITINVLTGQIIT